MSPAADFDEALYNHGAGPICQLAELEAYDRCSITPLEPVLSAISGNGRFVPGADIMRELPRHPDRLARFND